MGSPNRCTSGPEGTPCGRYRPGMPYSSDQCLRCWQSGPHTPPADRSDRWLATQPRRPVHLPCVHLGGETGELRECWSCRGRVALRLRSCGIHGVCTPEKPVEGVCCCRTCPDCKPDTYTLVAPRGTRGCPSPYRGRLAPRPWDYTVSACIPHCDTPEPLRAAIATLRWQSVAPYILVIDTGSPPYVRDELEAMRAADVEIHYIAAHGYVHSSEPVAVALDLAATLCRTEYLYHTHADAFAMRRDWIAWLLDRCDSNTPVIGYQMSERVGTDMWRGTPSHTATMLHMPTMRRIGASYSLQSWYDAHGEPTVRTTGWPDTESRLRDCLDAAGIKPRLIDLEGIEGVSEERNYCRTTDINIDHVRSYPSRSIYSMRGPGVSESDMADAIASAYRRAAEWRRITLGGG